MKTSFIVSRIFFRVYFIGLFCLFFETGAFSQQAVQFSQYIFNGLILNPAYSGYKESTNAHLIYRTQWTGLNGAPTTTSFTLDGVSKSFNHGFGAEIVQDKLGAQSNLQVDISYAYRLRINEASRLSFGFSAGITQYKLDGSQLSTYDPSENLTSQTRNTIHPDLGFGLFYATDRYFIGLSATGLLSNSFQQDPTYFIIQPTRYYYLTWGALFEITDQISFKPSLLLKDDLKGPLNVDFNSFFLFNEKLWVGGSYRTGYNIPGLNSQLQNHLSINDAASFLVEYYINPTLRIGYAFDYSFNNLQTVSSGSHELSVGLQLSNWYHHRLQNPRLF